MKALTSYFNIIYFVESDYIIRFVDTVTGTSQMVAFGEPVVSVFALDENKLLITTDSPAYSVYSIAEGETVLSVNESQAINLMNQAMDPEMNLGNQSDASIMSVFSPYNATQANDVSLPLAQYPVPTADNSINSGFNNQRPISWFHKNGQEGCNGETNCSSYGGSNECEGFGRYAHDAYLHITDFTISIGSEWLSSKHYSSTSFAGTTAIKNFFESLNTGAYIRYRSIRNPNSVSGSHSAVFLYTEGEGVWVYECNQEYDSNEDHGCGIQVQYYSYGTIAANYPSVAHYINHSFTEAKTYNDSNYHNVGCSQCDGYVRQVHSGNYNYTYLNTSQHIRETACCSGGSLTLNHVPASVTIKSGTRHMRYYSCCKYSVNENHVIGATYTYTAESETHHRVSRSCCSGYYTEEHVFDAMNTCIRCGIVYYSMRPVES